MKKIVEGENIVKCYGEGLEKRAVLDGVSAGVEEGEFICVMGPSGSGKSTLLFAMSGMDHIESGHVYFKEKNLVGINEKELADLRRLEMGFVFQQPTMLKNLNILDNIILPSFHRGQIKRDEVIKKAEDLMKKVGISELSKRDITQVSGGQLQRAGICRALMANPKIIFADEPTGALNSVSSQEIMDIFSNINREGTAIMLVTHDAKVAARSQRILFMHDGKIVNEMKLPSYDGKDVELRVRRISEKMQEIGI